MSHDATPPPLPFKYAAAVRKWAKGLEVRIENGVGRREAARRMGWNEDQLAEFLKRPMKMKVEDLVGLLIALDIDPAGFAREMEDED